MKDVMNTYLSNNSMGFYVVLYVVPKLKVMASLASDRDIHYSEEDTFYMTAVSMSVLYCMIYLLNVASSP